MARYSETIAERTTGRHRRSFRFAGRLKGASLLDVGCSSGWFERWAASKGCGRMVAIDLDRRALGSAMEEAPEAAYLGASSLAMPLRNGSFDKVVLWEVLEHLPERSEGAALREINRVLKCGGRLYLSTPNRTFWACALDPAWWLASHRHYSAERLKRLAEDAGFEVERVEYGGGHWELLSMLLLYAFKWVFRMEVPFKAWFEAKREHEFSSMDGWTNIFMRLRKRECAG